MHRSIFISFLLAFCSATWAETWTDNRGRSLEADVVQHDFNADMVEFALPTGRSVKMKISLLSKESQAKLRDVEAKDHAEILAKLKPGTVVMFTPLGDLSRFTYHCYIPTTYKADKRTPILLAFSPGGRGKGILAHFKEAAEANGWLVVGFDKLKNGMVWSEEERNATHKSLLNDVSANIPHHPYRVYMGGMSGGGMRSFQFAMGHPDLPFAGVISMGGWLGRDYSDVKITTHLAVAIVNGKKDAAANSHARENVDYLEGFDARVKQFSFDGGHVLPPKSLTLEVFEWLEEDWKAAGMKEQVKKMRAKP